VMSYNLSLVSPSVTISSLMLIAIFSLFDFMLEIQIGK
jgi:hypothetical protein